MVRSIRHPVGTFLDLAADLATDDTPAVLNALNTRITYIADNIVDGPQRTQFQKWIRDRFGPTLATLGLPGSPRDDDYVQTRRATLITLLGVSGGDLDVQRRARELASRYVSDPASLSGSLAPTVLQVAAMSGDRTLYDRYLLKLGASTSQPEEYYRFFNALAWFADPALIQETLKRSLSSTVRSQDTGLLLRQMLGLPWARDDTWAFIKDHWPALLDRLGVFQGIPSIIDGLGSLCSTAAAADVRAFFVKSPVEAVERGVQQAIDGIESCARIDARQSSALAEWLTGRAPL
jgi:aminopeptidase N/puromycin-sensitive aminopeptidase